MMGSIHPIILLLVTIWPDVETPYRTAPTEVVQLHFGIQNWADSIIAADVRAPLQAFRFAGVPIVTLSADAPHRHDRPPARCSSRCSAALGLHPLEERLVALHEMSDEPHARGRHFETLLADLFNAWAWMRAVASTLPVSRSMGPSRRRHIPARSEPESHQCGALTFL